MRHQYTCITFISSELTLQPCFLLHRLLQRDATAEKWEQEFLNVLEASEKEFAEEENGKLGLTRFASRR